MDVVNNELTTSTTTAESQIYNGGYRSSATIDPVKMRALYQAVITEKQQMAADGEPLQSYMHVGAALENPQTGAIEALYGGPGYPGWKYDGYGRRITVKECNVIHCEENMAVYAREQVGSSFKPYVLSTAVAAGMNVQGSLLDGQDFVCIPPDSSLYPGNLAIKNDYPDPATYPNCQSGWYKMTNDSAGENGPYSPQNAMTKSINTAYTDLWHYVGGQAVVHMAAMFGVDRPNSAAARLRDEARGGRGPRPGVADRRRAGHDAGHHRRQRRLSRRARDLLDHPERRATPDPGHQHPVFSQTRSRTRGGVAGPVRDVKDHVDGTATAAAMTDGREIIAKTGTTNTAQSAFFIGAIPQEALAVGMFTNHQSGTGRPADPERPRRPVPGRFGGTWPATIWHTYAQNSSCRFRSSSSDADRSPGPEWNLVPPNLRNVVKKHPKKKNNNNQNPNPGNGGFPSPPPGNGNPNPYPTYSCDPSVVTCNPNAPGGGGNTQSVSAIEAGAAMGGILAGLPATCLWVRRRSRRGVTKRG